jgi:hypothetical protein
MVSRPSPFFCTRGPTRPSPHRVAVSALLDFRIASHRIFCVRCASRRRALRVKTWISNPLSRPGYSEKRDVALRFPRLRRGARPNTACSRRRCLKASDAAAAEAGALACLAKLGRWSSRDDDFIAAICAATVAISRIGLLRGRRPTGNSLDYLRFTRDGLL